MDKGKVVEEGNHKELLAKKGLYYKLFISQVGEIETISENIKEKDIEKLKKNDKTQSNLVNTEDGEEYEYN
jgi:ATP-binding cassette subfamily B protein